MAVSSVVVTGAVSGTTGVALDLTSAGFGTPDAAIVVMTSAATAGNPYPNGGISIGYWDGVTQVCCGAGSRDGRNATDVDSYTATNRILAIIISGTLGATYTIANIVDGVRITKADGASTASRYVTVTLIKGVNAKVAGMAAIAASGVNQFTALGAAADLVCIATAGQAVVNTLESNCMMSIGAANIRASVSQAVQLINDPNAGSTTSGQTHFRSDCAVGQFVATSGMAWQGAVEANASGFNLNVTGTPGGDYVIYLALDLPNNTDANVAVLDHSIVAGSKVVTGLGFVPQTLQLFGGLCAALNTNTNEGIFYYGAAGPDTHEQSLDFRTVPGAGTTDTDSKYNLSSIIELRTTAGVTDDTIAVSSFDADGYTLSYASGAAAAFKAVSVAIGDSTGAALPFPFSIGGTPITGGSLGSTPITSVYLGATKLWP